MENAIFCDSPCKSSFRPIPLKAVVGPPALRQKIELFETLEGDKKAHFFTVIGWQSLFLELLVLRGSGMLTAEV